MSADNTRKINILVGGGRGVGKTALIQRYANDVFYTDYYPVKTELATKNIKVDDFEYFLELHETPIDDTGKLVRFRMQQADVFIIVHSVCYRSSLDDVLSIYETIKEIKPEPVCILIGNKCDLEQPRLVTKQEGEELALKMNCDYFEVSAKTRENLTEPFEQLVKRYHKFLEADNDRDRKCIIQ